MKASGLVAQGEGNTFSSGYAPGTEMDIPPNLMIEDTFLIKSETELDYYPITSWSIRKNATDANGDRYAVVPMNETYYLRPRQGSDVKCVGC